jgi:translation initiation factor IF-1
MVKNTRGGTGTKSLARKNFSHDSTIDSPPLPLDQFQRVVRVVKMLGNGILLVKDFNNYSLFAHLRNLSRRRISFSHNDILLVSLRPFENPHKHADVIFLYLTHHLSFISFPNPRDTTDLFVEFGENDPVNKKTQMANRFMRMIYTKSFATNQLFC